MHSRAQSTKVSHPLKGQRNKRLHMPKLLVLAFLKFRFKNKKITKFVGNRLLTFEMNEFKSIQVMEIEFC